MTAALSDLGRGRLREHGRAAAPRLVVLLVGGLLAACGVVSDDTASNLMVTPRKYQYHNCQLLAQALNGTRLRIAELQKLSARAAQEPVGQMISGAAYRTEYLQLRGDEKQILMMAREKNCQADSSWASERSLY